MSSVIETKEIGRKGRKILEALSPGLGKECFGKAIAINTETGDYFIGETGIEATQKAKNKYPDKIFFLGRVGYRTYVSFKKRLIVQSPHKIFDRMNILDRINRINWIITPTEEKRIKQGPVRDL